MRERQADLDARDVRARPGKGWNAPKGGHQVCPSDAPCPKIAGSECDRRLPRAQRGMQTRHGLVAEKRMVKLKPELYVSVSIISSDRIGIPFRSSPSCA